MGWRVGKWEQVSLEDGTGWASRSTHNQGTSTSRMHHIRVVRQLLSISLSALQRALPYSSCPPLPSSYSVIRQFTALSTRQPTACGLGTSGVLAGACLLGGNRRQMVRTSQTKRAHALSFSICLQICRYMLSDVTYQCRRSMTNGCSRLSSGLWGWARDQHAPCWAWMMQAGWMGPGLPGARLADG